MPLDAQSRPPPICLDEYRRRRRRLIDALPADAAVLLPSASLVTRSRDSEFPFRQDSDFHYLSGFSEPDALLVLLPGRAEGECVLFCQDRDPAMEIWTGRRLGAEGAVRAHGIDQAFENAERDARLIELLAGRVTLYLPLSDASALRLAEQLRAELVARPRQGGPVPLAFADVTPLLHEQRLIKSDAELALLRHAGEISADAHCRAMRACRPGLAEYQLQAELEHEFRWRGGSGPAYASIVAGGRNAGVLHYIDNREALRDGELVLIDAGAEFDLYAGDITRTFPVNGRFTPAQRALYEVVLVAQQRAIEAVRPGTTLKAIHQGVVRDLAAGLMALDILADDGEEAPESIVARRFYPHGTSHWLGLDVHDVGTYRRDGEPRCLTPGMVITIEPGLYMPDDDDLPAAFRGIGIRIEDDVAVTLEGCEVLTRAVPKQVADIEALMDEK
ncbi:M24 family metallopeptidase [Halomonas eurihalina]|uniref:Xaa-Pro aminopeptidase n=1 Tax=Halomonas eurihalina TaxID=42566 RepID=A0A5D9CUL3_HALER|nr:aminopeptidase P N-terminal domain-containing protein [Halomonas eurihalina]MDR5860071.1 aminopeptidase P N-terminal domain-containing protein [Halomonas eurihalina]TZG35076.1 M24 family metallopeptidase [Halomonas eurihalina]